MVALAAVGLLLRWGLLALPAPTPAAPGAVAVVGFENVSGDPELDWLRGSIGELFVTNLSQSPLVRVVATDNPSSEPVEDLVAGVPPTGGPDAEGGAGLLAGLDENPALLVLGSYTEQEGALRIGVRVQNPATGEIVIADQVQGPVDHALFELVDRLSQRVRARLEILGNGDPALAGELSDVTTASPEAYRLFSEGLQRYYYHWDSEGAARLYRAAVQEDPNFALALSKLVIVSLNAGAHDTAESYSRRSLGLLDSITERERHYVRGNHYLVRQATYPAAIEAYERALEVDPQHGSARHNLAFILFLLERYEESIEHLERLLRDGMSFGGTYQLLSYAQGALGRSNDELATLEGYLARRPESWVGHRNLGLHFLRWGRWDAASRSFERAQSLRPGELTIPDGWQLDTLRRGASAMDGGFAGDLVELLPRQAAIRSMYGGRSGEALVTLEQVADSEVPALQARGPAASLSAQILWETGAWVEGLAQAQRAQRLGRGNPAEWEALAVEAQIHAATGDWDESLRTARKLRERTEGLPTSKERRRLHHLQGTLAHLRGDLPGARRELARAEKLLPTRGLALMHESPQHVPVWFSQALVDLDEGEDEAALRRLERIMTSDVERLFWPIHYIRSHFLAAQVHERQGEFRTAQRYYESFLHYWDDGDLDRARVLEARAAVSRLQGLESRRLAS